MIRYLCVMLVTFYLLTGWTSRSEAQEPAPNFIIVLADDLGIGDIGPYGSELIRTPNLDRMAAEGIRFSDFYASANICTASRAGLLTGRYPNRMDLTRGVAMPTNRMGLDADELTLAELLKQGGYATALIGKWHLGHRKEHWPTRHGFDVFYGLPYSNDMKPLALYRGEENIEEPVDQRTLTERYTSESIAFVEANADRPFFLYLAHTMPHVPLFVSKRFERQSRAGLYGDVVETLDWSMGQIFETLERLGIDEQTLVVFTSDNGPWWEGSSGSFRGRKGTSWEGGMRVPLLARWPGQIPAGAESTAISMNIDLFPTLAHLAGIEVPNPDALDGRNIFPVLQGHPDSPHDYLVLFDGNQVAAIRTQEWKLVQKSWYRMLNFPIGGPQYYYYPGLLFDMRGEALERYSMTREYPEIAAQLRAMMDVAVETIVPGS